MAQWHKGRFEEPCSDCGEWVFSLNVAMTCSSAHARDTAQLSPRVGGWEWQGQSSQPLCSSSRSSEDRTSMKGSDEERLVCLFPLTATSNSWIMVFVFGILEGMIPFPLCVWIFSLLPTYPPGPRRTLESTIVFWPLSPPLSGAPHKDCCLNSLGQEWKAVPRVSAVIYTCQPHPIHL